MDQKEELAEIEAKYKLLLEGFDKDAIEEAYKIEDEAREIVRSGKNVTFLNLAKEKKSKAEIVFQLLEAFKLEIKRAYMSRGINVTHITDLPPEELEDGKLRLSKAKATQFEAERGDYVFASSSKIDGTNLYIARNSKTGMIVRGDICVYGSDIFKEVYDANGAEKRLILKNPNYVYNLNPRFFSPVAILKKGADGKPFFDASHEWVSEEEMSVYDKTKVREVTKVDDVTDILKHYQIFTDVRNELVALQIIREPSREKQLEKLKKLIKVGKLRYINGRFGINTRDEFREDLEDRTY